MFGWKTQNLHRYRTKDSDRYWFIYLVDPDGYYKGLSIYRWTSEGWKVIFLYDTSALFAELNDMPYFPLLGEIR